MFDDTKIEHYLAISGVVVTVLSTVASLVNHVIRDRQVNGETVPRWLLNVGALMNLLSANFDKTLVLVRAARGKPLVSGTAAATASAEETK